MPTDPALLAILREVRQRLHALYGDRLVRAVLYGSHARGDAREDSDVDVLVVLKGDVDTALEDRRVADMTYDLWLETDWDVHCLPLAEARTEIESDPLMMNVREEGSDFPVLA